MTKRTASNRVSQSPDSNAASVCSCWALRAAESTGGIAGTRNSHNLNRSRWHQTELTTHDTAFRWPTKSLSHFHPSRSMIWAVGPPPFMACDDTKYKPSGDHEMRRKCVVPPHSSNGSLMVDSHVHSLVRHTFKLRSSLWDARYLPTGSHVTPLTKPVWPFRVVTIAGIF